MTKTAVLLALIVTALPAQAQQVRAFVSGSGLDTNPCTLAQPCRTFQHAHDIVPANALIEALDPAGYQPLTITKGISIQGHGYSSIFQTANCPTCAAITISVTTSDPVTLNGLFLDGAGTGQIGVNITSGTSVQILNCVVRHFQIGIVDAASTNGSKLLIEDTVASDNPNIGIVVQTGGCVNATLNRITANNNQFGVGVVGNNNTTIANSVMSNNSRGGLISSSSAITWLAKSVISGNAIGVQIAGATVNSYGDNYLNDNTTPVAGGTLMPVTTQ
jgi:Periplasmic copper-binding protein (NosD)